MPKTTPQSFEAALHRELRKIYVKTLLLRLTAGLVSFLALGAWVVLALVVWTALTAHPALSHTLAVMRLAGVVLAVLFAVFVPLVYLTTGWLFLRMRWRFARHRVAEVHAAACATGEGFADSDRAR